MGGAPWKEIVHSKRCTRDASIPTEWLLPLSLTRTISEDSRISVLDVPAKSGILTPKELEITGSHDAVALLQKMASRELSSYEVTLAFCKRAAIAQQVVSNSDATKENSIAEILTT